MLNSDHLGDLFARPTTKNWLDLWLSITVWNLYKGGCPGKQTQSLIPCDELWQPEHVNDHRWQQYMLLSSRFKEMIQPVDHVTYSFLAGAAVNKNFQYTF